MPPLINEKKYNILLESFIEFLNSLYFNYTKEIESNSIQ